MKFSVVTISFNQAEFIERTIWSVLGQSGVDIEYIVVDPGSTDGSRDLIARYSDRIAAMVFEPDQGPADGLNRGFALATGDVFCYLNADDVFEPSAFIRVADYLRTNPQVDVACGHAWVTDKNDRKIRRVWSEPFRRLPVAYGMSVQIQPSTFIRSEAFRRGGGFNVENRSNWDGELLIDLYKTGARFGIIDEFLSSYRLHAVSITNSGRLDEKIAAYSARRFELMMNRPLSGIDLYVGQGLRVLKHVSRPGALLERVRYGPMYRRGMN